MPRFGAVPVVRRTGGLNDTVFDVDHDAERAAAAAFPTNGFSFDGTDAAGIDYALNRHARPYPAWHAGQWRIRVAVELLFVAPWAFAPLLTSKAALQNCPRLVVRV